MTNAEREQGLIEALKIIATPLIGEPSAAAYRLLLAGQVVAKELDAARKALADLREESAAYQCGKAAARAEIADGLAQRAAHWKERKASWGDSEAADYCGTLASELQDLSRRVRAGEDLPSPTVCGSQRTSIA
jgi:hypothetical protein